MCNKLFFLHGLLLQGVSVDTIKTKANVCCVQFPTDSGRTLAFGSADHKIYYYDLRSSKMPLCTLVGHKKTVSYVKFIDSTTLVSASTDNTLKLWDLSTCTSKVLDCPMQSFTGHLNVKVSFPSFRFGFVVAFLDYMFACKRFSPPSDSIQDQVAIMDSHLSSYEPYILHNLLQHSLVGHLVLHFLPSRLPYVFLKAIKNFILIAITSYFEKWIFLFSSRAIL